MAKEELDEIEETGDNEEPKPKRDMSKIYMIVGIVVAIILTLSVAGGISYFLINKMLGNTAVGGVNGKAVSRKGDTPGKFVKIGDPKEGVIVNIGGGNSSRYLKVNMIVEIDYDKDKDAKVPKGTIPTDEILVQDAVVKFLRSKKAEDLTPDKQDKLKDDIKKEVDKVIGAGKTYEVYITNFVLQ